MEKLVIIWLINMHGLLVALANHQSDVCCVCVCVHADFFSLFSSLLYAYISQLLCLSSRNCWYVWTKVTMAKARKCTVFLSCVLPFRERFFTRMRNFYGRFYSRRKLSRWMTEFLWFGGSVCLIVGRWKGFF